MKSKVYQGQCFLDKVLENSGSIENAFAMALLNGTSVTDDVVVSQELKSSPVTNKVIVALFGEFNRPATGVTKNQIELIESLGIGSMTIGTTLIVR